MIKWHSSKVVVVFLCLVSVIRRFAIKSKQTVQKVTGALWDLHHKHNFEVRIWKWLFQNYFGLYLNLWPSLNIAWTARDLNFQIIRVFCSVLWLNFLVTTKRFLSSLFSIRCLNNNFILVLEASNLEIRLLFLLWKHSSYQYHWYPPLLPLHVELTVGRPNDDVWFSILGNMKWTGNRCFLFLTFSVLSHIPMHICKLHMIQ